VNDGRLTTTYEKGGAMPLGPDVKYRFKKGTHTRLAFAPGGKVIEAKNMQSGKTHTPAEFEEDREGKANDNAKEEKAEAQKRFFRKGKK
jgi:hypothetical protein